MTLILTWNNFIRTISYQIPPFWDFAGMILTSALIIWKGLIVVTGSESPVVVVLSESMEPGFQRVRSSFPQYNNQHSFALFYILHLTESSWMLVTFMPNCAYFFSLLVLWHTTAQGRLWLITWIFSSLCTIQKFCCSVFSNVPVSSGNYKISTAIFVPSADGLNSRTTHYMWAFFTP